MNAAEQLTFLDAAERCGDEDELRRRKFLYALYEYQSAKPLIMARLRRELPDIGKTEIEAVIDDEIANVMIHLFGELTFAEIGKVFGYSRQYAEAVCVKALAKCRNNPLRRSMLREFIS